MRNPWRNVLVELGLGHAIVAAIQGRAFARSGRVKTIQIWALPAIPVGWAARSFALLPPVASELHGEILAETARAWRNIPDVKLLATG